MLPKSHRLNLKKDYQWTRAGMRMEDDLLRIFFRGGKNLEPKVGIALSSSVFKKAVERNRARRLVSKGIETWYSKLSQGLNLVIIPKSGILGLSSDDVTKEMEKILKKVKLV